MDPKHCKHLIGYDHEHVYNFDQLVAHVRLHIQINKQYHWKKSFVKVSEFLDKDKGYFTKFLYCPKCGELNSWKSLTSKLEKEI